MMNNVTAYPFGNQHTPQQVLVNNLEHVDRAEVIVVAVLTKDGEIHSTWSDGSSLTRIGLLETAKDAIMIRSRNE